tara:strand:- start:146 stop:994 length:849 start_codon:yes stop_codon:yes gene_type:complete
MTEKREPNPINKITFNIISEMVDETEMLTRLKDDWGFIRHPRSHPDRNVTFKLPKNIFYIAIITSPEKWKGKIAGYCGIGISDDLLIDSGAYTLGGPAAGVEREGYAVDVRDNKVYTQLREKRNDAAESLSKDKEIPFLVLLRASRAANYYMGRGYIEHSQNIPEWAIKSMEKFPDKEWYVYNENDAAMKKAWDILKRKKHLHNKTIKYINEIMSDGEERTSRNILDAIMDKVDNNNLNSSNKQSRETYHFVPTTVEIGWYIKNNPIYIKTNKNKPYRYAKE